MTRLRMAVIGVGHLGKEHARIVAGLPDVELVGVVDVNAEQAQNVARAHGTQAFAVHWPLLTQVDAAVIAVPTCYHHAIARDFLCRGIPLLVEKPLTAALTDAEDLATLARRHQTLLQVGHIERFNPAFEELQRHPMQPKFIEAERIGPYTGRSTDIGVVHDLMIHDLDLLLTLAGASVTSVDAIGVALMGGHEDVVNARLTFANGCVANLTASRVSPRPARRLRVWAPEGYASVDFARRHLTLIQPSEQLRLHRPGSSARGAGKDDLFRNHLQTWELDCDRADQLTRELQHFVQCVQTGATPRVSGDDGWRAVALATRILEQVATHRWNGTSDGPIGPSQLPVPLGPLFSSAGREAA